MHLIVTEHASMFLTLTLTLFMIVLMVKISSHDAITFGRNTII
jgi:hypothetical protein